MKQSKHSHRVGFTLVELLVTIGIIALLISILLPALNKARRAANLVVDLSNVRQIYSGMRLYGTEYGDAIPGAPSNTAGYLFYKNPSGQMDDNPAYSEDNCPAVVTEFDWMSPILRVMGTPEQANDDSFVEGTSVPHFNAGGSQASRLSRFEFIRNYRLFHCPENQTLAGPFAGSGGPSCSVNIDLSYYTAASFLELPLDSNFILSAENTLESSPGIKLPNGYKPYFSKVANASQKICVFCGEVYTNSQTYPDINLKYDGWAGGSECFTDLGSFSVDTLALPRNFKTNAVNFGSIFNPLFDPRPICYRHGDTVAGRMPGRYKFTAVFYDGHAEVLDDVTGANPSYWVPSGTVLNHNVGDSNETKYSLAKMWADTAARYGYTPGGPNKIP
jgi:type II secretory pathway pseudopilin PulG